MLMLSLLVFASSAPVPRCPPPKAPEFEVCKAPCSVFAPSAQGSCTWNEWDEFGKIIKWKRDCDKNTQFWFLGYQKICDDPDCKCGQHGKSHEKQ